MNTANPTLSRLARTLVAGLALVLVGPLAAQTATPTNPKSPVPGFADGRGPTGPVELKIVARAERDHPRSRGPGRAASGEGCAGHAQGRAHELRDVRGRRQTERAAPRDRRRQRRHVRGVRDEAVHAFKGRPEGDAHDPRLRRAAVGRGDQGAGGLRDGHVPRRRDGRQEHGRAGCRLSTVRRAARKVPEGRAVLLDFLVTGLSGRRSHRARLVPGAVQGRRLPEVMLTSPSRLAEGPAARQARATSWGSPATESSSRGRSRSSGASSRSGRGCGSRGSGAGSGQGDGLDSLTMRSPVVYESPGTRRCLVDPPLILAPMAGITDMTYRLLLRKLGGVGLVTMEFVSSEGLTRGNRKTRAAAPFRPGRAAALHPDLRRGRGENVRDRRARRGDGVDVCDLNMGCPANKVLKGCAGAGLMRDLSKAKAILAACRKALTTTPMTVKFRLGISDEAVNYLELARICEGEGAAAVALHARTAKQMYTGSADWSTDRAPQGGCEDSGGGKRRRHDALRTSSGCSGRPAVTP